MRGGGVLINVLKGSWKWARDLLATNTKRLTGTLAACRSRVLTILHGCISAILTRLATSLQHSTERLKRRWSQLKNELAEWWHVWKPRLASVCGGFLLAGLVLLVLVALWHVCERWLGGALTPFAGDVVATRRAWVYDKRLDIPIPLQGRCAQSAANCFQDMMQFQLLSGDIGAFGKRLYTYLWWVPLLPAVLFLTWSMHSLTARWVASDSALTVRPTTDNFLSSFIDGLYDALREIAVPTFALLASVAAGAAYLFEAHLALRPGAKFPVLCLVFLTCLVQVAVLIFLRGFGRTRQLSHLPATKFLWLFLAIGLGCLQHCVGTFIVRDTLRLREAMKAPNASVSPNAADDMQPGGAPRLFQPAMLLLEPGQDFKGQRHKAVLYLLDNLKGDGVLTPPQLRDIRQQMISFTIDGGVNIVSVNSRRAALYIVVTILCTLFAVTLLPTLGRPSRLAGCAFVFASYVAIGLAFGLMYYDYYLLEASRYHELLEILTSNPDALARSQPPSDPLIDRLNKFRSNPHRPRFLRLIESGFFASAVFSQDTPEPEIEADAPDQLEPLAACTYQFKFDESAVRLDRPLSYSYAQGAAANWTAVVSEGVDKAEACKCVATVLRKVGLPGDGGWSPAACDASLEALRSAATNRSSRAQLVTALCSEALRHQEKTDRGYKVKVVAAADCSGEDPANDKYSSERAQEVIKEAYGVEERLRAGGYRIPEALAQDLIHPERDTFPQRKGPDGGCEDDDVLRLLWPTRKDDQGAAPAAVKPEWYRAAAIQLYRRGENTEQHIDMRSGLTRDTTLSDMVYFSFVSLTTTGYGDIRAVSGPVRFCVIMENILVILFTAIFFAAAMTGTKG